MKQRQIWRWIWSGTKVERMQCNQRLVLSVAKKWLGQGMELADLM
jgi:DNA-directed RNA polymerase sigma subunit (sigma70/sigma32)